MPVVLRGGVASASGPAEEASVSDEFSDVPVTEEVTASTPATTTVTTTSVAGTSPATEEKKPEGSHTHPAAERLPGVVLGGQVCGGSEGEVPARRDWGAGTRGPWWLPWTIHPAQKLFNARFPCHGDKGFRVSVVV